LARTGFDSNLPLVGSMMIAFGVVLLRLSKALSLR
jgi:hypothetical protein